MKCGSFCPAATLFGTQQAIKVPSLGSGVFGWKYAINYFCSLCSHAVQHELLLKKMLLSLVSRAMQRSGSGSICVEGAKVHVLDRPLHVGKHHDLRLHKGPFCGH